VRLEGLGKLKKIKLLHRVSNPRPVKDKGKTATTTTTTMMMMMMMMMMIISPSTNHARWHAVA
jgi:hypothetical protein